MKTTTRLFLIVFAIMQFNIAYLSAEEIKKDSIEVSAIENDYSFELSFFTGENDWKSGMSGMECGYGFDNSTISVKYWTFPNYTLPIHTYRKSKELSYTKVYGIYPFLINVHYTDRWTLSEKKVEAFCYDFISANYKYTVARLGFINLKVSSGLGYGWGFSREAVDPKTTVLSKEETSKGVLVVKEYTCSIQETSHNGFVIPLSIDIGIDIFDWLSGSLSYGYLTSSTFSTYTTKYTVSFILFRN